jgi:putative tryptophan/tyrosine transport system substrate-binding protein
VRRREFITVLGGAALSSPFPTRAQIGMPVVGFLAAPAPAPYAGYLAALHQGLRETGYVEGQNLLIEYRWAEGQYDRLPALATELVSSRVAVIVTIGGAPSALAAKAATSTIPIVFHMGADPVQLGLVASLSRPGGNVTGATLLGVALDAKRLELLRELMPAPGLLALLVNEKNPQTKTQSREVQEAAQALRQQILIVDAGTEHEIDLIFPVLGEKQVRGLLIGADTFLGTHASQIAALAARYEIPTITQQREYAVAGGLMSYGANIADVYRQAGVYAGRILKGEKPSDLPVTQPTKFELVVNLKTAKALRIEIPPTLLARADEVIE